MIRNAASILLCEDDLNLSTIVVEYLRDLGYIVDKEADGKAGLETLLQGSYDLCISDVLMPEMTGIEMVKELRESGKEIPVILVSEQNDKESIKAGYQAGCNEYVTKPFSMDILACKIQAWLRHMRQTLDNTETTFQLGSLTFDSVHQTLNGTRISSRENELLLMLCRKQGQMVERSHILKTLWGTDNYFASRSLSVYINHLRHYLSADKRIRIIVVHGKGYKIVIDE